MLADHSLLTDCTKMRSDKSLDEAQITAALHVCTASSSATRFPSSSARAVAQSSLGSPAL